MALIMAVFERLFRMPFLPAAQRTGANLGELYQHTFGKWEDSPPQKIQLITQIYEIVRNICIKISSALLCSYMDGKMVRAIRCNHLMGTQLWDNWPP
jgi:hypothetical protein